MNLTTKFWDTLSDQNQAMATTSKEVLGTPQSLGALPLIVLSASLPADEGRAAWTAVNAAQAAAHPMGSTALSMGQITCHLRSSMKKYRQPTRQFYR